MIGGHPVAVAAPASRSGSRVRWVLMFGNFVIGFGVMAMAGTLNDVSRSLDVSIALAGQLVAIGAASVGIGAPLLAGWVAGFDRRRLLFWSLVWYGVGHLISAATTSYAALAPIRAMTMLGAAVYTPQAAAAIGHMTEPAERGRAITFIFLGWSLASVLGLPLAAWISERHGWQAAFETIAAASLLAAVAVATTLPNDVRPAALSRRAWGGVLTHPLLMALVSVTALSGAGQFVLFSYMAPYLRNVLGASAGETAALLMWFGLFGLIGNLAVMRLVDRIGPHAAVGGTLALMAVALLCWPLGTTLVGAALILVPWGLGCFASNSTQQARLGIAAPAFAPALMALNTSAIYLGQAVGAAGGGWLIGHRGYAALSWAGLVSMLVALALSSWVGRRLTSGTMTTP